MIKGSKICGISDLNTLNSYLDGTTPVSIQPSEGYTYNGTNWVAPTDQWLYDLEASRVRLTRKYLLARKVDPVVSNNLRWLELSLDKQEEWRVYRRALLDLPESSGFPHTVTWPTEPT